MRHDLDECKRLDDEPPDYEGAPLAALGSGRQQTPAIMRRERTPNGELPICPPSCRTAPTCPPTFASVGAMRATLKERNWRGRS